MNQIISLPAPADALSVAPISDFLNGKAANQNTVKTRRQSMRKWYLEHGSSSATDLDLLEMLLYGAMPMRDTRHLAEALLTKFGDLPTVIAAPKPKLKQVAGVQDHIVATLKLAEGLISRSTRARLKDRQVLSSWEALLDYCHGTMAHKDVEHLRILFLDRKNQLIVDEDMGRGTIDRVPLYPREIMRKALEHNATALIVVHNHPTGDPTPSDADIALTDKLCDAAEALSITIHEHLIIGCGKEFSFREAGLL